MKFFCKSINQTQTESRPQVEGKKSKRKRPEDVDIEQGTSFAISEISIPTPPVKDENSTEKACKQPKQRQHFSWFAYGRLLTPLAIVTAVAGFTLSFLSMRSTAFVKLHDPIKLPNVHNVSTVGLLWMRICFDETSDQDYESSPAGIQAADVISTLDSGHRRLTNTDKDESFKAVIGSGHRGLAVHDDMVLGGCHNIRLTLNMVDDRKWNAARSFLALAIALGGFLMIVLSTSIYWESINLKPVCVGLLLTYFFQSLSFFLFDSDMCRKRGCALAEGSIMGIVAGVMWFVSALVTIRMDGLYRLKQRKLKRQLKRQQRREERRLKKAKAAMQRHQSTESTGDETTENPLDISDTNLTPSTTRNLSDSDEESSQSSTPSNYFVTNPWI